MSSLRWRCELALFGLIVCSLCSSLQAFQNETNRTSPPIDQAVATKIDTLVFCPQPFQNALTPWLSYRRQQGHRIEVLLSLIHI